MAFQLFFLDSGAGPVSADFNESPETPSDAEDEDEEESRAAVWHDSDDDRLTVSLASHQRLRKLRVTEAEDMISGKEYIRRLRRQFQQMNPVPDWANPEVNQAKNDGSSADDMDTDDEEEQTSTQPLAKLLQNATDLTRVEDNTRGGKRKLRQEVLDIQRLKDVGRSQPVSSPTFLEGCLRLILTNAVFCRFAILPPPSPRASVLWTGIYTLLTPRLPVSTSTQPPPNLSSSPAHTHPYLRLRPTNRQQSLRLRPPTILPHLGPGHRQDGQSQRQRRPQRRAKNHGTLQAVPLRPVHRASRLGT